ncbi:hypothetical protein QQ045_010925 [Rhodiola kirilowii]
MMLKTPTFSVVLYMHLQYLICGRFFGRTWEIFLSSLMALGSSLGTLTLLLLGVKKGGNNRKGKSLRRFNDFMANCGVSDLGFQGPSFTCCNNQSGMSRIWERLDKCLMNGMAVNQFSNLKLRHLPRNASDHCPILLYMEEEKKRRHRGFKFMGMWTSHRDFPAIVNEAWSQRQHINP